MSFLAPVIVLGPNLMITIEHGGPFGTYVKLARGKRFITFSTSTWLKLRRNVPMLQTCNYNVSLTEAKDVAVFMFNDGVQYVSFRNKYKQENYTYINLNREEWASFLAALNKIDAIIPPTNVMKCPSCNLLKMVVPMINGRPQETTLSPEMLQDVRENNKIAYNQEMYRCEYCGGYSHQINSSCHCHRYDCRECEPNNFCATCGDVNIFAV